MRIDWRAGSAREARRAETDSCGINLVFANSSFRDVGIGVENDPIIGVENDPNRWMPMPGSGQVVAGNFSEAELEWLIKKERRSKVQARR